jgi:hypothetical protein
LNQLQAAIVCAREYIGHRARRDVRPALNAAERVFKFACRRQARDVYRCHGIEVFEAVFPWPELGEAFVTKRYPQMQEFVGRKRGRGQQTPARA